MGWSIPSGCLGKGSGIIPLSREVTRPWIDVGSSWSVKDVDRKPTSSLLAKADREVVGKGTSSEDRGDVVDRGVYEEARRLGGRASVAGAFPSGPRERRRLARDDESCSSVPKYSRFPPTLIDLDAPKARLGTVIVFSRLVKG